MCLANLNCIMVGCVSKEWAEEAEIMFFFVYKGPLFNPISSGLFFPWVLPFPPNMYKIEGCMQKDRSVAPKILDFRDIFPHSETPPSPPPC